MRFSNFIPVKSTFSYNVLLSLFRIFDSSWNCFKSHLIIHIDQCVRNTWFAFEGTSTSRWSARAPMAYTQRSLFFAWSIIVMPFARVHSIERFVVAAKSGSTLWQAELIGVMSSVVAEAICTIFQTLSISLRFHIFRSSLFPTSSRLYPRMAFRCLSYSLFWLIHQAFPP